MIKNSVQQYSVAHNKSHSNISLPSDEKTPLRLPIAADCLSPLSHAHNGKNKSDNLSQNSYGVFGISEIKSTSNNKNFKKIDKFTKKQKYLSGEVQTLSSKSPSKSFQSHIMLKNQSKYNRRLYKKKLDDNLTSSSSIPRQLNKHEEKAKFNIPASEIIKKKRNGEGINSSSKNIKNKTSIENKNTSTTNRNLKVSQFKSSKENYVPIDQIDISKVYDQAEEKCQIDDHDLENIQS